MIPNDVVPEEICGPMGCVDDVFVCVSALRKLQEKYSTEKLARLWDCNEELGEVINYSYQKSLEIMEQQGLVGQVLEYSGLAQDLRKLPLLHGTQRAVHTVMTVFPQGYVPNNV